MQFGKRGWPWQQSRLQPRMILSASWSHRWRSQKAAEAVTISELVQVRRGLYAHFRRHGRDPYLTAQHLWRRILRWHGTFTRHDWPAHPFSLWCSPETTMPPVRKGRTICLYLCRQVLELWAGRHDCSRWSMQSREALFRPGQGLGARRLTGIVIPAMRAMLKSPRM